MASINEIHNLMTTARAEHPVASSAIAEFIQTYKQAREDSDDAIRESAAFIARALQEHARGWLDDDDMIILLEGQRDLARLRANNAQIALGSRIRSTVIRLIDIALALLVGALLSGLRQLLAFIFRQRIYRLLIRGIDQIIEL